MISPSLLVSLTLPWLTAAQPPIELDAIRVEAPRTELAIDRVPAAVSVLERDEIQRARMLLGLGEVLNIVPGVFIQNRFNAAQDERISVRGFGARASFGIRGVQLIVDGIPATLPDGQAQVDSIDLASAERIEVLRGPSSALYGNAAGGVIAVTTESGDRPAEIGIHQLVGELGLRRTQLRGDGAWSNGDVLVSASHLERDGFREHSRVEERLVNAKLRWHPGTDTTVTSILNVFDSPQAQDPGGVTAERASRDPEGARPRNVLFDAGEAITQHKFGLQIDHRLDAQHALEAGGFIVGRDFANRLPFVDGGQVAFDRVFGGADLQYEHSAHWLGFAQRLTLGLDARWQDDDRRRFDNLEGTRGPLVLDQQERIRSLGLYALHRIELAEHWTATLGLRADDVELDVDDRFLANGDDSGTRSWSEISPSFGLSWRVREDTMLYANIGTAFQTPTTTELANPQDPGSGGGFNPDLGPQDATSYELGARARHGPIGYELALFRARIDDAITSFEVPAFSGTGRDFFRNAGRAVRNGIEASLKAKPLRGLDLRASYAYSDFQFERFRTADGVLDGNRLPGVPEHQLDLRATYETPGGYFAATDLHAVSDFFANNANSAQNPGYAVVDMRFGRGLDLGRWFIEGFVGINNVFDERYNANVRVNAFGGRFFEPAPGRNVYAGISLARRLTEG